MNSKDAANHVAKGLKNYYFKYIMPIEARTHFDKCMMRVRAAWRE